MLYGNTKTEKIHDDLHVIMICWAKLYVFRRPEQKNILLFQCSMGHFT